MGIRKRKEWENETAEGRGHDKRKHVSHLVLEADFGPNDIGGTRHQAEGQMLCRAGSWEATFILPRAHFCWGIRWRKWGWYIQTAILHDQSSSNGSTIKFLLLTRCWLYTCTWKYTINALSGEMCHSNSGHVQKSFFYFSLTAEEISHRRSTLASEQSVCQQPREPHQQQHSHGSQRTCESKHTRGLVPSVPQTHPRRQYRGGGHQPVNLMVHSFIDLDRQTQWRRWNSTWQITIVIVFTKEHVLGQIRYPLLDLGHSPQLFKCRKCITFFITCVALLLFPY